MVDALKDGMTAWLERVRSPIAGSIVLAFVAVNWQPIWFVIWSDVEATERFLYFDENTNWQTLYLWPVIFGFLLGILGPWLRWFGSLVANYPTKKYREIEDKQASDLRIDAIARSIEEQNKRTDLQKASEEAELARAKSEEAADNRMIARAKRAELAQQIDDGAAANAIRDTNQMSNFEYVEEFKRLYASMLDETQREIIRAVGTSNPGFDLLNNPRHQNFLIEKMRKSHPGILESRLRTVLQNSMNKLEKDGIVQLNKDGQSLTAVGSEIFDLLD